MDTRVDTLGDADDWNTENGLTYSVVPPANPQCSIARTKTERILTFARSQSWGRFNPNLFSLAQIPLNWKEHIFHTGKLSSIQLQINLRE